MAKKDDFDDWDDDDFGDFDALGDFDVDPGKDDRKPVTKLKDGAIDGIKSSLKDPAFLKKHLLTALPPGYSKADTLAKDLAGGLSDLYNETAKELQPLTKAASKATKAALPKIKNKLPKKLADKLQDIVDRSEDAEGYAGVNADEAGMSAELASIFGAQNELQVHLQREKTAEDRLSNALLLKKHSEGNNELTGVRIGVEKLVGYQDKVNIQFQRKTLELQFKQYFIQRDALELSKETNKVMLESLQSIMKNTALPEFVKVNTNETAREMLKQRGLAAMGGKIQDYSRDIVSKIMKNAKSRVSEKLGIVHDIAGMADMGSMLNMGMDMPGGKIGMAGNIGGGIIADFIANTVAENNRDYLAKKFPKLVKGGNLAAAFTNNFASKVNDFASGRTKIEAKGWKGSVLRGLRSLMPQYQMDTGLQTDSIANMRSAVPWDVSSRKAITEVIPGYLARILQSLERTRTGQDADLLLYDVNTNKFSSSASIKSSIMSTMFNKDLISRTNTSADDTMKKLLRGGKLSKVAWKEFRTQIISDVSKGREIRPDVYIDPSNLPYLNPKSKRDVIRVLRTKYQFGPEGKLIIDGDTAAALNETSQETGWMEYSSPYTREVAQRFIDAGYGDILEEAGVIKVENGKTSIDFEKFLKIYQDGLIPDGNPNSPTPFTPNSKGPGPTPFTGGGTPPPQQTRQSYYDFSGPSRSGEKESVLDEFKNAILDALVEAKTRDTDRNVKLDEIIIRLDNVGGAGQLGPGSMPYKDRIKGMLGSLKGVTKNAYGKLRNLTTSGLNMVRSIGGMGYNTIMGVGSKILGKFREKATDLKSSIDGKVKLRWNEMKAGEYYDSVSGKVIKKWSDIKGEVKDRYGNVVLTAEEFKAGLLDNENKKVKWLKNLLSSAFDKGNTLAGKAVNAAIWLAKSPFKLAGKILDAIDGFKDVYVNGETAPRLLKVKLEAGEYYNLKTGAVIKKMSEIKDGVFTIGKGKRAKRNVVLTEAEASSGLSDGMGSVILAPFKLVGKAARAGFEMIKGFGKSAIGLAGKAFGKFKGAMSGGSKEVILLTQIRDLLDQRLPKSRKIRKGSFEDQLSNRKEKTKWSAKDWFKKKQPGEMGQTGLLAGMLGGLGGAISGLTTVLGGAFKLLKLPFTLASGVLDVGKFLVTNPLVKGAALLGGKALMGGISMAGSAIAGIASMITAPVAIAVGAVVGGYFLYKYLTKPDAYLSKIRLAQYGFDPEEDEDKCETVGKLESLLYKKVSYNGTVAQLNLKKDVLIEALKLFNIDPEEKAKAENWANWYLKRFKPVFLSHCAAMKRFGPGENMLEADDKVPMDLRPEYVKAIKFSGGESSPYTCHFDPFDISGKLPTGESLPKKWIDEALEYYAKELKKDKKDTDKKNGTLGKYGKLAFSYTVPGMITKYAGKVIDKAMEYGGKALNWLKGAYNSLTGKGKTVALLTSPALVAAISISNWLDKQSLDPFVAVRLKTYGLKELDKDKVSKLLSLEGRVGEFIKYTTDKGAVFTGSVETLFEEFRESFGIGTGLMSSGARKDWMMWFTGRFMPTYLTYYTFMKANSIAISLESSRGMKPTKKLEGAKIIMDAKNPDGVSVWKVEESPFTDGEINDDVTSAQVHVKVLEEQSKGQNTVKTLEKTLSNQEASLKKSADKASNFLSNAAKGVSDTVGGWWKNVKSGASDLANKAADVAGGAYNAARNTASAGMEEISKIASNIKGWVLGMTSKRFESGKGGPGTISSGAGDLGGKSYGTYQLASSQKVNTLAEFLRTSPYGSHFQGLRPGSAEFDAKWKELAKNDPEGFEKAQHDFIKSTHYDIQMNRLKKNGFDFSSKGPAVHDSVWSTSVQFGGGTDLIMKALAGKDVANMSDADIVSAIQDYKAANNDKLFTSSSAKVRAGTLKRAMDEKTNLLALASANISNASANDDVAKTSTGPSAPPPMLAKGGAPTAASATAGLGNLNPNVFGNLTTPTVAGRDNQSGQQTTAAAQDSAALAMNVSQQYQEKAFVEQRKNSDEFMNGNMKAVGDVLAEQLVTQKNIYSVLQEIRNAMNNGAKMMPNPANGGGGNNLFTAAAEQQRQPETIKAPINVSRRSIA